MSHHPGYVAVQWFDTEYRTRWVAREDDSKQVEDTPLAWDESPRYALDKSHHCHSDALLMSPFRLTNGNTGRRMIVPICRKEKFLGFLIAVIDEPRALAEILADDTGLGYGIAVMDGDTEVFSTLRRNSENDKKWGQEAQVPLLGVTWRVRFGRNLQCCTKLSPACQNKRFLWAQ
jgi:hypothetical protein